MLADPTATSVVATASTDGSRVTVVAPDRVGLLADSAAMLALQRTTVRAARAWTQGGFGVSVWEVGETGLDDVVLRQRLEAIAAGRVDVEERLGRVAPVELEPTVAVRPDASATATVRGPAATQRSPCPSMFCPSQRSVSSAVPVNSSTKVHA